MDRLLSIHITETSQIISDLDKYNSPKLAEVYVDESGVKIGQFEFFHLDIDRLVNTGIRNINNVLEHHHQTSPFVDLIYEDDDLHEYTPELQSIIDELIMSSDVLILSKAEWAPEYKKQENTYAILKEMLMRLCRNVGIVVVIPDPENFKLNSNAAKYFHDFGFEYCGEHKTSDIMILEAELLSIARDNSTPRNVLELRRELRTERFKYRINNELECLDESGEFDDDDIGGIHDSFDDALAHIKHLELNAALGSPISWDNEVILRLNDVFTIEVPIEEVDPLFLETLSIESDTATITCLGNGIPISSVLMDMNSINSDLNKRCLDNNAIVWEITKDNEETEDFDAIGLYAFDRKGNSAYLMFSEDVENYILRHWQTIIDTNPILSRTAKNIKSCSDTGANTFCTLLDQLRDTRKVDNLFYSIENDFDIYDIERSTDDVDALNVYIKSLSKESGLRFPQTVIKNDRYALYDAYRSCGETESALYSVFFPNAKHDPIPNTFIEFEGDGFIGDEYLPNLDTAEYINTLTVGAGITMDDTVMMELLMRAIDSDREVYLPEGAPGTLHPVKLNDRLIGHVISEEDDESQGIKLMIKRDCDLQYIKAHHRAMIADNKNSEEPYPFEDIVVENINDSFLDLFLAMANRAGLEPVTITFYSKAKYDEAAVRRLADFSHYADLFIKLYVSKYGSSTRKASKHTMDDDVRYMLHYALLNDLPVEDTVEHVHRIRLSPTAPTVGITLH